MFTTTIYGKQIQAKTLKGLKCKASKIANRYHNTIDEMVVTISEKVQGFPNPATFKLTRINKKSPNNTIVYGQWK